ncbi:MAG: hypothetical protein GF418_06355 [Chitinivibrionales bacterium]|nr:hypothetical protein [Chitinivibrionales bacterium]MBD3395232.1 hypothetical protein [Chitinivibrionales bacterium]
MQEIRDQMIRRAIEAHNRITPCSNKEALSECFSLMGDKLVFWFNTDDDSTHVLVEELR